jgi:hypothetical protein
MGVISIPAITPEETGTGFVGGLAGAALTAVPWFAVLENMSPITAVPIPQLLEMFVIAGDVLDDVRLINEGIWERMVTGGNGVVAALAEPEGSGWATGSGGRGGGGVKTRGVCR